MIPVSLKPEPNWFDRKVRRKGKNFLAQQSGTIRASSLPDYWKTARNELHRLYQGICAYTCLYELPPGTIDHFLPKSKYQDLAYEWSNYRLSSGRANQRKGDHEDIIDPFAIQDGWFTIDFPSCLVMKGNALPSNYAQQAEATIERLKLNKDDSLVQERCDIVMNYRDENVNLQFLRERYPFIAIEIERQNLEGNIDQLFKRRTP